MHRPTANAEPGNPASKTPANKPTRCTLTKAIRSVVSGYCSAEQIASVLVRSTIEDTLLCVARDYGHEYGALLAKYVDVVASRQVSGRVLEKAKCLGKTISLEPCGNMGDIQGYCKLHAKQLVAAESQKRKVEAYRSTISKGAEDGVAVAARLLRGHQRAKRPFECGIRVVDTREVLGML